MHYMFTALFMIFATCVWGQSVYLMSGEVIEGEIVEEVEDYIKVKRHGHSVTYFRESIEKIERADTKPKHAAVQQQIVLEMQHWQSEHLSLQRPLLWSVISQDQLQPLLQKFSSSIAEPVLAFSAAEGLPAMVAGNVPRLQKSTGYQEVINSITADLKEKDFKVIRAPYLDYCAGQRVISLVAEQNLEGQSVIAEKVVFFKRSGFFYIEIYLPAQDYESYKAVLRLLKNSISFKG